MSKEHRNYGEIIKSIKESTSHEELLGFQQDFLVDVVDKNIFQIGLLAYKLSRYPLQPQSRIILDEIEGAISDSRRQLNIVGTTIIGRLLYPDFRVPVLDYGHMQTLYIAQGEPTYAQRVRYTALPIQDFARVINASYRETVLQNLTGIQGQAQRLVQVPYLPHLPQLEPKVIPKITRMYNLSELSAKQLQQLVIASKTTLGRINPE